MPGFAQTHHVELLVALHSDNVDSPSIYDLSPVAWTIVVHCFTVFLAVCYNVCSQFKMLLHVLSLARGGVIISPQFFVSCTGYQSASEFISRLPTGFSRHWPVKHPLTSPTTAAWYQTQTVAASALLTLEHVSPHERLRDSVTEVYQLLVLKFGTVYRLHSGLRTWRLTVSNEDFKTVCIGVMRSQRLSDYWFLALYKYSLCM